MKDFKVSNFVDLDTVKEFKVKQKEDLNNEVQQYFSELDMIHKMIADKLMTSDQFFLLYDDICGNLNRALEELNS